MILIQHRQKHGLTQADVATGIGVTVVAVSHYENGKRIPKQTIMARIYRFTGGEVTANDFHGVAQ